MSNKKTVSPEIVVIVPNIEYSIVTGATNYCKKTFGIQKKLSFKESVRETIEMLASKSVVVFGGSTRQYLTWLFQVNSVGGEFPNIIPSLKHLITTRASEGSDLVIKMEPSTPPAYICIGISHPDDKDLFYKEANDKSTKIKQTCELIEIALGVLIRYGCNVPELRLECCISRALLDQYLPPGPCIDHLNLLGLSM